MKFAAMIMLLRTVFRLNIQLRNEFRSKDILLRSDCRLIIYLRNEFRSHVASPLCSTLNPESLLASLIGTSLPSVAWLSSLLSPLATSSRLSTPDCKWNSFCIFVPPHNGAANISGLSWI